MNAGGFFIPDGGGMYDKIRQKLEADFVNMFSVPPPPENPKVRDGREWAHDTLLEYQLQDPQGAIARERQEKRRTGVLKFVCHECALGDHEVCKERNEGKQRADCDCGHMARRSN